jgi:serine/threonine protein kinase
MYYFSQILSAVSYMHRMGIVHRDIKAENIFLTRDLCQIKIGDFGTARDVFNPDITGAGNSTSGKRKTYTHFVGTPHFMAPEAIDDKENDEVSDIWSLGCLLYQMLIGIPPFVAGSQYLVFLRVKHRDLQFPEYGVPKRMQSLIDSILQVDRAIRPSVESLRSHFPSVPQLPPLSPTDLLIRSINRLDCVLEETDRLLAEPDPPDRLRMLRTVLDWESKSREGAGTAMVDHLNLPELTLIHPS